jgi:hypothetical protein
MIYTYDWVIESVDMAQKHIVVTYTMAECPITLNIPTPVSGADIPNYVKQFAPLGEWLRMFSPVPPELHQMVGIMGTETVEYPPKPEIPHGINYLTQAEVSI